MVVSRKSSALIKVPRDGLLAPIVAKILEEIEADSGKMIG